MTENFPGNKSFRIEIASPLFIYLFIYLFVGYFNLLVIVMRKLLKALVTVFDPLIFHNSKVS
jgi:hypothetical protein